MAVTKFQIFLFPRGNKPRTFRKKKLEARNTCNLKDIASPLLASWKGISPSPWYVPATKTMPSPEMPLRGKPFRGFPRVWHHQSAANSETPSTSDHPGTRCLGWFRWMKQDRRLGRQQVFLLLASTLLAPVSKQKTTSIRRLRAFQKETQTRSHGCYGRMTLKEAAPVHF